MIGALCLQYYSRATAAGCAATVAYARKHGVNLDLVDAHAGIAAVLGGKFHGNGHFSLADDGEPAFMIEAYGEDAATTIDLVAWPLDRPDRFATAIGAAPVLGWTQVTNPATWAFGSLLKVHQTPLEWLRAGCDGVVILDHKAAPMVLADALGRLQAADAEHAARLKGLLCRPPVDPARIVYPRHDRRAAA